MGQKWLISGSPGCGKTTWILNKIQSNQGACGYLRLTEQANNNKEKSPESLIDYTFLKDQAPHLQDLSDCSDTSMSQQKDFLILIELSQSQSPESLEPAELNPYVKSQLEALGLQPDRQLHFGRDSELPNNDTLVFKKLESWSLNLAKRVWDPQSLNTFWFELVNGAYGDVYRAKALMNLPDGQSIFFNWIVSQKGSQFLPLKTVSPPNGRPQRPSGIVIQGKGLDCINIQSTINLCLLNDSLLEMHQMPLRDRQPEALHAS
ncbi:ATPase [Prochlorococcus marinus]|uniref:ATPase n=1 Tax=Prochlorococcus marinus TaxID=1219 RepID=UPI0022B37325|nr:ATPase [Prochlorococcus marinus]